MYKHILVPTDGSTLSGKAARAAARLAKSTGARSTAIYFTRWYPDYRRAKFAASAASAGALSGSAQLLNRR